ncbi:ABC transporter permease [Adlercreutzia equolifaciens]|uniref:FtsX-like permease family protein n=1 Tax=Adlercreutzia equolifaciens TaxID=446660 RepID=UPI0023AF998B|nr:FtsX-like permease family protein [Adlercreutzia equolifaciens]MDE8702443.1 ABC transporter permease [Adlercreutzia equolifaciens]
MSAFDKDVVRSIRHSLGRFVAIAAIVALGTGFYAGLRMTAPDMNLAADAYYDGTALMDIRVVSTMGLTEDDMNALRQVDGVYAVMPAYQTDVLATLGGEQYAMRVHSLPDSAAASYQADSATVASDDRAYLNRLELAEGRWPENAGECLIFNDRVMSGPSDIGDVVTIDAGATDLEDTLKRTEFTIVGKVHSPLYVSSTAMGTTTLGSGTIQQFMYIPQEDFDEDFPISEAFVAVKGARELDASSDAYQQRIDEVTAAIEAIAPEREQARVASLQEEAQKELDEKRAEYKKEKAKVEAELADAEAKLKDARKDITSGKKDLKQAQADIAESEEKLADGQKEYDEGVAELKKQRADAEEQFAAAQEAIDENQKQVDAAAAQLPELQATLEQLEGALTVPGLPEEQKTALEAQKAQVAAAIAQIEQGQAQLKEAKAQLKAQREAAEEQFAAAQKKLDAAKTELEEGQKKLEKGKEDYEQGKKELSDGRTEYREGKAEYDENASEAADELERAEKKLEDAQREIDDLATPEWLVMDRTKNSGVVSFEADAERIDSIASFFPFIFFLVAALVALTTMTRMVDEERPLIGTFKALGYSRGRITSKYLIYAAAASLLGSIVGIAVLSQVLPWVIMEAYSIVYFVPRGAMPVNWPLALAATGLGVGITLVATWAAAAATLRETPASLMLPRAPKAGKRILLERIGPLWRHLSFSWKVTLRNLFRYKKRLVMTVIGIAGCTALLLTGLGLQNSINDIIDVQYGQLVHYNVVVSGDEDAATGEREKADALLAPGDTVQEAAQATVESVMAVGADGTEVMTTVVAPEDPSAFGNLWTLRTRSSQRPVTLSDGGVVLTEKLASLLGVGPGDKVRFAEQDTLGNATDTIYTAPVAAVVENYVANYAFMTPTLYERTFGETGANLTVYAKITEDPSAQQALSEALRDTGGVETVAFNEEVISSYKKMLRSVDMVVVVLVVAAAALAFIVLYNLTNINITERAREIATLKVLGFLPREVDAYIFREIALLSLMGALLGLALGVVLEGFVVTTAEVDQVMFGRTIHGLSFLAAFVLTMVFTLLVTLVMRPKLAHVDMVESLKSNE